MKTFSFAAALFMGATLAGAAAAECAPFTENAYADNLTHAQVSGYVTRVNGGDWSPYVTLFEGHVNQLKAIRARASGIVVNHNGRQDILSGTRLTGYIQDQQQRLDVTRCLAGVGGEGTLAAARNDVAAAAPVPSTAAVARSADVAQSGDGVRIQLRNAATATPALGLEVTAVCREGRTEFQVTNYGDDWPRQGEFEIYRLDGENKRQLVSARRLRLNQGQKASFRVKARQNLTGRMGIFVNPIWYQRPFNIDAEASCG